MSSISSNNYPPIYQPYTNDDGNFKDSIENDRDTTALSSERSEILRQGQENLIEEGAVINPELYSILGRNTDDINSLSVNSEERSEVEATLNVKPMALLDDTVESLKSRSEPIHSKEDSQQADKFSKRRRYD